MRFTLHFWGIFCCLCSCAISKNIAVRPDTVNIGALFTFNSTIGTVAKVAISAAVNDINNDSSILPGTKLVVQMQDSNCSGFISIVQALQFMEKDTVAIIGPQSSVLAHVISHVANELQVPMMSFAATDPTLSSLQYPFFVRTTHSDQFQMASVAALVDYYGWKQVTAIFIDDDYGRNGISSLGDELAKRRSKILYKAAIRPGAKNSEIANVLAKVAMMESRVIILHANPNSGLAVLSLALNLRMTSSGYVWIATDWLSSFIDSSRHLDIMGLLSTMQGVLTLRQHTENTRMKSMLASQWSALVNRDSPDNRLLINSYGLYAYDTVWMIAHALDEFFSIGGNISFSIDPNLREAGMGLQWEAMTVFDGGKLLLESIHKVNFTGAAGLVKFDSDGNLIRPAYDIVNIVGSGLRTIGYWSNYSGLSTVSPETLHMKPPNRAKENQKLHDPIWPGETVTRPRGWVFANNGIEIKIGVPSRVSYRQFVSIEATGVVHGFCVDVFTAAINLLEYPVSYKLVPFGDGRENPSYTQLISKILTHDFDAAIGDITIVTNRTRVVDFTQPYMESGLVILTSVKTHSSTGWAFLQPFTISMWTVTGLFFLVVGTMVWLLEHRINDEFRGPPTKQIITVFWFSFSTLFFAHREDTRSTLGRFVLIIWLFVVLIVQSSYTANLTSILTVQQLSTQITGIDNLISSDEPIGFQVGSFAENYLVRELGVSPARLKALGSPDEYREALELGPGNGGVAAIVDERPYIELFLFQHPKFAVVGSEFTKSGWGFAFPRDSQIAVDLSTAILALSENGDLQRIHDKWLASGDTSMPQTNELDSAQLQTYSFSGLFLICGVACLVALAIHAGILVRQYYEHATASSGLSEQAALHAGGSSRRSSLRAFLSFADRRETDTGRTCKRQVGTGRRTLSAVAVQRPVIASAPVLHARLNPAG